MNSIVYDTVWEKRKGADRYIVNVSASSTDNHPVIKEVLGVVRPTNDGRFQWKRNSSRYVNQWDGNNQQGVEKDFKTACFKASNGWIN